MLRNNWQKRSSNTQVRRNVWQSRYRSNPRCSELILSEKMCVFFVRRIVDNFDTVSCIEYGLFSWKYVLGRVRLGSIQNKNNWNNASKRFFGSYSHSGIPRFPFRLFCSQEQNSRNIFRNIFLFRNCPNEQALKCFNSGWKPLPLLSNL